MKQIVLLLAIVAFTSNSCKKDENNNQQSIFIGIGADILYKNSIGNDLLDVNIANHFNSSDIKLYNLIKGVPVVYFQTNYDNPKGFFIYRNTNLNSYCLALPGMCYGSAINKVEYSDKYIFETIDYIQLSNIDTDTIKCLVEQGKDPFYLISKKIWYNGVLKWSYEDYHPLNWYFEVIK